MPVRDFASDANGDLGVFASDFGVAGGDTVDQNQAAVAQGIDIRLKMFTGDNWIQPDKGVDYLGKILVKSPDANTIAAELTSTIASTPDVVAVSAAKLEINARTREAAVSFAGVQTTYSTVALNGSIVVPQ